MAEKTIAILVPCFNEEKTIGKVISDFKEVLPDAEIYVYDNNSSDNTAKVAEKNGARVRKEVRQGKGNVVRSMFRDIIADCYIMVDGDDTYPAAHASEMAGLVLNENVDMVIGDRLSSTYFTENKRRFHNTGNKIVRLAINKLFKSGIKDIMTGYRAFSYNFVKMMPVVSDGFEIETEMTIHALDKKFNIREIEVQYRDRPEGSESKLNTVSDGIKVLKTIFLMLREYRPFMFFAMVAVFLGAIALILFIPVLVEFYKTGLVPRFPTMIISLFIAVFAILSFVCGLILDVVVTKSRQAFFIELNKLSGRSSSNGFS